MSCVREASPTSADSDISSKQDIKKRRFHPLRNLKRIFRRKGRSTAATSSEGQIDSLPISDEELQFAQSELGTTISRHYNAEDEEQNPHFESSRSHSTSHSHLIDDTGSQRRSIHSTVLSVSHDSIFTSEQRSPDSGSESSLYNPRLGFPHSSIRAELFEAVHRRRACDPNASDDEDLGLPRSPVSSSPTGAEDMFNKANAITKSQSTCSDGSLLSIGSCEIDEDLSTAGRGSRHPSKLPLPDKRYSVTSHERSLDFEKASITTTTTTTTTTHVSQSEKADSSSSVLCHNAAKHKLAIKPKRTHGLPNRKRQSVVAGSTLPSMPELNEEGGVSGSGGASSASAPAGHHKTNAYNKNSIDVVETENHRVLVVEMAQHGIIGGHDYELLRNENIISQSTSAGSSSNRSTTTNPEIVSATTSTKTKLRRSKSNAMTESADEDEPSTTIDRDRNNVVFGGKKDENFFVRLLSKRGSKRNKDEAAAAENLVSHCVDLANEDNSINIANSKDVGDGSSNSIKEPIITDSTTFDQRKQVSSSSSSISADHCNNSSSNNNDDDNNNNNNNNNNKIRVRVSNDDVSKTDIVNDRRYNGEDVVADNTETNNNNNRKKKLCSDSFKIRRNTTETVELSPKVRSKSESFASSTSTARSSFGGSSIGTAADGGSSNKGSSSTVDPFEISSSYKTSSASSSNSSSRRCSIVRKSSSVSESLSTSSFESSSAAAADKSTTSPSSSFCSSASSSSSCSDDNNVNGNKTCEMRRASSRQRIESLDISSDNDDNNNVDNNNIDIIRRDGGISTKGDSLPPVINRSPSASSSVIIRPRRRNTASAFINVSTNNVTNVIKDKAASAATAGSVTSTVGSLKKSHSFCERNNKKKVPAIFPLTTNQEDHHHHYVSLPVDIELSSTVVEQPSATIVDSPVKSKLFIRDNNNDQSMLHIKSSSNTSILINSSTNNATEESVVSNIEGSSSQHQPPVVDTNKQQQNHVNVIVNNNNSNGVVNVEEKPIAAARKPKYLSTIVAADNEFDRYSSVMDRHHQKSIISINGSVIDRHTLSTSSDDKLDDVDDDDDGGDDIQESIENHQVETTTTTTTKPTRNEIPAYPSTARSSIDNKIKIPKLNLLNRDDLVAIKPILMVTTSTSMPTNDRITLQEQVNNNGGQVVLRKKSKEILAPSEFIKSKDDQPELMKVFARRSLKLKETTDGSIVVDTIGTTTTTTITVGSDTIISGKSRDSDKENEYAEDSPTEPPPRKKMDYDIRATTGVVVDDKTGGATSNKRSEDIALGFNNNNNNNNNNMNNNTNNQQYQKHNILANNGSISNFDNKDYSQQIITVVNKSTPSAVTMNQLQRCKTMPAVVDRSNEQLEPISSAATTTTSNKSHYQQRCFSNRRLSKEIMPIKESGSCTAVRDVPQPDSGGPTSTALPFKGIQQRRAEWEKRAQMAMKVPYH